MLAWGENSMVEGPYRRKMLNSWLVGNKERYKNQSQWYNFQKHTISSNSPQSLISHSATNSPMVESLMGTVLLWSNHLPKVSPQQLRCLKLILNLTIMQCQGHKESLGCWWTFDYVCFYLRIDLRSWVSWKRWIYPYKWLSR